MAFDRLYVLQTIMLLLVVVLARVSTAILPPSNKNDKPLPTIVGERVAYKRWRTIVERKIQLHDDKILDFDLVGMAGASSAVVIFAWNSTSKTATLVREYHPGPNCYLFGAAAGIVEDDKHNSDPILAAQHELEEECHLAGGTWYLLTPTPIAQDKYHLNTLRCFLVVDALHVPDPKPQDHEEDIEIVPNVSIDDIKEMIQQGQVNVIGCWACLLAIEKLRELGEIE